MSLLAHLKNRHMDLTVHKVWLDFEQGLATFPLYTLNGKMGGYQQYNPAASKEKKNHPREGRYYTWVQNSQVVWGLESWSFSNTLFLTEGIFDAARLTERGVSAIAMIANDPKHLQHWLWMTRQYRPVVAVCDQDVAGMKLAKYGHESYIMSGSKDLGDASDEEVDFLINRYK